MKARYLQGFGLVELMIALVLGLMVIGGVTSVFLSNKQSFRTNNALSQVQEGSRIAFELMAREIRQAGLPGCGRQDRVANVLRNGPGFESGGDPDDPTDDDDWWAMFEIPIRGYEADAGVPSGTGAPSPANLVATADSVEIRGLADTGLSIEEHHAPNAQVKISDPTYDIEAGDIVVICDPLQASIVQITNYSGGTNVTVVHNQGAGVATPGNCTKDLTYYETLGGADCTNQCTGGGTTCHEYGQNSQIAKVSASYWYIGTNPQGGTSLYRMGLQRNTNCVGTNCIGLISQEMVRDVTDMQLQYLFNGDYEDADDVTNWGLVTAVRLALTLRGSERVTATDGDAVTRSFTSSITLRNRVN